MCTKIITSLSLTLLTLLLMLPLRSTAQETGAREQQTATEELSGNEAPIYRFGNMAQQTPSKEALKKPAATLFFENRTAHTATDVYYFAVDRNEDNTTQILLGRRAVQHGEDASFLLQTFSDSIAMGGPALDNTYRISTIGQAFKAASPLCTEYMFIRVVDGGDAYVSLVTATGTTSESYSADDFKLLLYDFAPIEVAIRAGKKNSRSSRTHSLKRLLDLYLRSSFCSITDIYKSFHTILLAPHKGLLVAVDENGVLHNDKVGTGFRFPSNSDNVKKEAVTEGAWLDMGQYTPNKTPQDNTK